MNIIILGPQGSGKGTQATNLKERLNLVHIASGDVLRAARASDTELGREVRRYYDAGELVPDAITVRLIIEAIRRTSGSESILLDGFPRTVAQAEALERALMDANEGVDAVIELQAPLETVKARLAGRRICRVCGAVYNVNTKPPRAPGACDLDGGELYQREDDRPEAIERRLAIWARENEQLLAFYACKGIVTTVDADRSPVEVTDDIVAVIEGRGLPVAKR